MESKKIWKIFFSPTGTTKSVVSVLADELSMLASLDIEDYDFTLPHARKKFADINHEDIVVFGVPTYAGRIPNVLLKYLNTIKGNGAVAIPIVTFGNRNFDNSLIELKDILEYAGFRTIAGAALSCEHAFSYTLGAGRPDEDDKEEIRKFAQDVFSKICNMSESTCHVCVPGEPVTYGGYYSPRDRYGNHIDIRKVTPKVNDSCLNCKLCADICPMGSIDHENILNMTGICIKCGACFKRCPVSARYFDDLGYLYHKEELEEMYAARAWNKFFL